MAANLLGAGHGLVVFTRTKKRAQPLLNNGATWADCPADAVKGRDVVFTCLPGPQDVESVVLDEYGVGDGIEPGSVYIDTTTSSPSVTRRIHDLLAHKNVAMLDAPLSGGVAGAVAGNMAIIVGGDERTYRRVKPVLDVIGDPDKVVYCGPSGAGMICKLCNNMINLGLVVLLAEALTLGVKAGMDLNTLVEVISKSTGATARMDMVFRRGIFQGNFEPGFSMNLGLKDLRLAIELAREMDLPMEMAALAEQKHIETVARGWGNKNTDAVAILQEERAGVQLRLT
jgi:3-hydroxyisobutyrate dehydrogenase